jgi:hypothetical protein
MLRRLSRLTIAVLLVLLPPGRSPALESGYTFNRLVFWSEGGEAYPRFERDPETGEFSLLFLGPVPESGWDPVQARRLVMHGPSFLPADPVQILRPRDPDPDWASTATEASFDLNRDGVAEIVRARTVMIPDNRDPSGGEQRVLVELLEGSRILFADLLEGPDSDPVKVHSIAAAEFTRDGFPDMMVRLESRDRGGIAFYSQAPLRYEKGPTVRIPGFSPTAFRPDRYGIFDLSRNPREFFSRLPAGARPSDARCGSASGAVEGDGHGRCRFLFSSPYLGWVREFRIDFIPDREIVSFELFFPTGTSGMEPEQALDFLTPVLGGGFKSDAIPGNEHGRQWTWEGKTSTARLLSAEIAGKSRVISLRLQRNPPRGGARPAS